ncbi:adenosine deaminase domain-containing protein 2 [Emydura macquarii macquarii]|uniref:adenosine deaminase domain-containing protein 2 n=1 Tax=Emydura macquarii macquarii TaxID=1129001 RepID=UPI00352BBE45
MGGPEDPLSAPTPPCVPAEGPFLRTGAGPLGKPTEPPSQVSQRSQSGHPDAEQPPQVCFLNPLAAAAGNASPHAQRCAALASDAFDRLLAGHPQHRSGKSSLAAFILEREVLGAQQDGGEQYELVALGTGGTCYGGWLDFSGRRLHDTHALVVARRALRRYLYKQLLLWCGRREAANREKCIFQPVGDGGRLEIKPRVFVHLYLSQAPAGAAEDFPIPFPGRKPSVGLCVHARGALSPVSGCPPGLLAARVCCASGRDKLSLWGALGWQGALLSHFLQPLHPASIVLADPGPDPQALSWVITKQLPAPHAQRQAHFFLGPRIGPPGPPGRPPSLNWCSGDPAPELVDGTTGLAAVEAPAPEERVCASRLCKAAMLRCFREVAREMNRDDLLELPTYHQAKAQAEPYQRAKERVFSLLASQGLGKWPRKQLADIFTG